MADRNVKEAAIAGLDTDTGRHIYVKSNGGSLHVMDGLTTALDHTLISGLSSVTSISDVPTGTQAITCQVETQNVRMTFDGSATPTTTVGHEFAAGTDQLTLTLDDFTNLQMLEQSASATVQITFWG